MELSRRTIQRMILRKSGDTTVINQGSEGGGGGSQPSVALGPLLTSLNSEAMPSAEGYLHWTGSAWEFPPIDLSDMATKTWVGQNFLGSGGGRLTGGLYMGSGSPGSSPYIYWGDGDYVYIGEDSDDHMTIRGSKGVNILTGTGYNLSWNGDTIATETWVGQQGYLTSSAISDMATMTWVGQQGYLTSSAISDMATKTWVGQQGYLTSSAISDMATKTWVGQQGYITQATADGRYLSLTGGTLKGPLTFADSNGNSYGAIRAEKIGSDEYLYLFGNDGVLIDGLSVRKDSAIVPIEDVFLSLTGGTMEPGATITLQEIVDNIPVQTLVASQRWVNAQGFLTSADLSGYATTSALTSGLAGKQNIIHFLNTKNNNNEVGFSYFHLPLSYSGAGHASLDLSDYVTALGVSGDYVTWTRSGATNNITVPFATDSKALRNFFDSRPTSANNQYGDGKLRHYMATSSMTTGKPPVDAHIIHSAWDYNNGFDAQLAIGNSDSRLYCRTQYQGAWQTWKQMAIIDDLNTLGDNLQSYVTTQLGGYLPLTAGSSKPLTGNIAYKGTKATHDIITFIDNTADIYGNGIVIGGGGATIIGGGESASVMASQLTSGGNEVMYIGNDGAVIIFTNLGTASGWANRKEFFFDIGGSLSVPSNVVSKAPNGSAFRLQGANYDIALHLGSGGINRGIFEFSPKNNWLLYFDASNTILNHGNVGIGTATPSYKLDVNGNFHASGNAIVDGSVLMGNVSSGIEIKYDRIDWLDRSGNSPWTMGAMMFHYDGNVSTEDVTVRFELRPQVLTGTNTYTNVALESDVAFASKSNNQWMLAVHEVNASGNANISGSLTANGITCEDVLEVQSDIIIAAPSDSIYFGSSGNAPRLYVYNGSLYYNNTMVANGSSNGSDIRMKDVIKYLEPSVRDVAFAPLIEFDWKEGYGERTASHSIGSIAQYWQSVFPQAVYEGKGGMLCLDYGVLGLASAITAARHSLDNERRIAELELRVAELEGKLAAMVSQQRETTYN